VVAIPIGIYAATHQYSVGDHALTVLSLTGLSTPQFLRHRRRRGSISRRNGSSCGAAWAATGWRWPAAWCCCRDLFSRTLYGGRISLSIGLGLRPPVVSWGVLLNQAQNVKAVALHPWMLIPAVFVIVSVLAFNLLGDGLRDAADPYASH
jgi:hypothetical protein